MPVAKLLQYSLNEHEQNIDIQPNFPAYIVKTMFAGGFS